MNGRVWVDYDVMIGFVPILGLICYSQRPTCFRYAYQQRTIELIKVKQDFRQCFFIVKLYFVVKCLE